MDLNTDPIVSRSVDSHQQIPNDQVRSTTAAQERTFWPERANLQTTIFLADLVRVTRIYLGKADLLFHFLFKIQLNRSFHLHVLIKIVLNSLEI